MPHYGHAVYVIEELGRQRRHNPGKFTLFAHWSFGMTDKNVCRIKESADLRNKEESSFFLFFLNNQPNALINPILFCYKTLHVLGILSAHHREFSTVRSALVSFTQVSDDHFQAESGWKQFHPDSAW